MMDILSYIRSWFVNPTEVLGNKRRTPFYDDFDSNIRTKMRRVSGTIDDDWLSSASSGSIRRYANLSCSPNNPGSRNEIVHTINLEDDDDDVIEVKRLSQPAAKRVNKSAKFTSTPSDTKRKSLLNGNDSLLFGKPKDVFSEKRNNFKSQAFNGKKASNLLSPVVSVSPDSRVRFGMPRSRVSLTHSPTLDETFRLDEKMKYKELLEKAAPNITFRQNDSFSQYHTPRGKMFSDSRSKRMLDLVKNADSNSMNRNKLTPRRSTRDTIIKILDKPVVINDSDSDVEILPTPPSPKPDIKVERVNSLKKTVIDLSETSQPKWLTDLTKCHIEKRRVKEAEIEQLLEHRRKLGEINNEIRLKTLEENIRKCLSLKEIILPVTPDEIELPELTDEHHRIIARAFSKNASQSEVLVSKFNLNITRQDILTLAGLNWLNDEVINFYMNLIMERSKDSKWPKTYSMNTFFYPKLLKDGPSSLRRWTRKVDIFAHDLIAVPIHLGMHWCMSIIDFRAKSIKYYDSMGGSNHRVLPALMDYLEAEHLDKKKTEFDDEGWETEIVRDIPQQMNGSDCGMFSCTFAEFISRDAKITFSQEDMPYLRKKMVVEIIKGQLLIT